MSSGELETMRPTNVRLLSVFVAGAFSISGCVTTTAVAPAGVAALAGLREDKEADLQTSEGWERVNGSTQVTLRAEEGRTATTSEARLSSLRTDGGTLIFSEDGRTVALNDVWSAEVTKPSPGKTAGLVVLLIVGTAATAGLVVGIIYMVAVNSLFNSLSRHE